MASKDAVVESTGEASNQSLSPRRETPQNLRVHQERPTEALRRMQREFDAAQARYLDFYDLAPVGYVTTNQESLVIQANLTAAALLGLPRGSLMGRALPDFMFPSDAEVYRQLSQRVLVSGRTQSCDLRIRKPNGSATWIWVHAMTATGDDGATVIRMVLSDISERKQAEASQLSRIRLSAAILDSVPSQIAVLDYAGNIVAVNQVWRSFAQDNIAAPDGDPNNAFIGVNYLDICDAVDDADSKQGAALARGGILRVINGTAPSFHIEYPCHSAEQLRWFSLTVTPLHLENHAVVVTHTDITKHRQLAQVAKQASEDKFKLVADNTSDGIIIFGADKQIQYVSPACVKLFGYSEGEELNRSLWMISELVHPQDRKSLLASLKCALEAKDQDLLYAYRFKHRQGHYLWREDSIRFQYDASGQFSRACVVARDITARIAAEEEIRKLAYFDQLTGLPNRSLFVNRLQQVLADSSSTGNCAALLSVDMDNFKTLKHTLGQDVGNQILQQVAQRLTDCVQAGDTVARFGGDEFMVVLSNLGGDEAEATRRAKTVAESMLFALSQPYQLGLQSHHCGASIGVTLCLNSGVSVDELMKQVDLAMFHAKAVGPKVLRFFDPDMALGVKQRIAMEHDLRQAVAAKQFVLHYQAQVEGAGRVTGAEVLVRWLHPVRGMVPPGDFIKLAEDTGLILVLGRWVLETACAQLKRWGAIPGMAHLTLAVNVSALQFAQTDFVEQVVTILQHTGANPLRLKLELTESLLVGNVDDIVVKMTMLKAKGIGFSLDDFGTGFSSLAYLSRLPLDQLKIDRSFVNDVVTNPDDAAIARTIIALAHSLNLGVIAEGVETDEQRLFLADAGCHDCQGYFFSRPLEVEDFEAFALRS